MIGGTQRRLDLICGGTEGLDLLQQAAGALADSQSRLEHVHALIDLGAA
jgi:hypothetical protein